MQNSLNISMEETSFVDSELIRIVGANTKKGHKYMYMDSRLSLKRTQKWNDKIARKKTM